MQENCKASSFPVLTVTPPQAPADRPRGRLHRSQVGLQLGDLLRAACPQPFSVPKALSTLTK